jgi:hypothetical protein
VAIPLVIAISTTLGARRSPIPATRRRRATARRNRRRRRSWAFVGAAAAPVYVFHAGDDVLQVAKDAYALYQSANALGPLAFPSLRDMEAEVVERSSQLLVQAGQPAHVVRTQRSGPTGG